LKGKAATYVQFSLFFNSRVPVANIFISAFIGNENFSVKHPPFYLVTTCMAQILDLKATRSHKSANTRANTVNNVKTLFTKKRRSTYIHRQTKVIGSGYPDWQKHCSVDGGCRLKKCDQFGRNLSM
jgi:hypothetical protein